MLPIYQQLVRNPVGNPALTYFFHTLFHTLIRWLTHRSFHSFVHSLIQWSDVLSTIGEQFLVDLLCSSIPLLLHLDDPFSLSLVLCRYCLFFVNSISFTLLVSQTPVHCLTHLLPNVSHLLLVYLSVLSMFLQRSLYWTEGASQGHASLWTTRNWQDSHWSAKLWCSCWWMLMSCFSSCVVGVLYLAWWMNGWMCE